MAQPGGLPPQLTISWSARKLDVPVQPDETVGGLKQALAGQTGVSEGRMKLLGFATRKPLKDTDLLRDLYKPGAKLLLIGTPQAQAAAAEAEEAAATPSGAQDEEPGPADDPSVLLPLAERPENREKLEKRIASVQLKIMNPPRPGKKCLVLDIDYTIFDLGSSAERPEELARPFLHSFLTEAYKDWDLVIWSATNMKWIEVKMRELGVSTHPEYKICCFLDCRSMVTVFQEGGRGIFDCKPLPLLWAKVDAFTAENTLMLDDLQRNFIWNMQNGLVIKPYRKCHKNRATDRELLRLGRYLALICKLDSLAGLDHSLWKEFTRSALEP